MLFFPSLSHLDSFIMHFFFVYVGVVCYAGHIIVVSYARIYVVV